MFFRKSQIDKILSCKKCSGRIDEPYLLPCGITICKSCFLSTKIFKKNKKNFEFNCFNCYNDHECTPCGLQINENLANLILEEPEHIWRGKKANSFTTNLQEIKTKMKVLNNGIYKSIQKIEDHCSDISLEIESSAQNAHNLINMQLF